jgi:hypothetical protein
MALIAPHLGPGEDVAGSGATGILSNHVVNLTPTPDGIDVAIHRGKVRAHRHDGYVAPSSVAPRRDIARPLVVPTHVLLNNPVHEMEATALSFTFVNERVFDYQIARAFRPSDGIGDSFRSNEMRLIVVKYLLDSHRTVFVFQNTGGRKHHRPTAGVIDPSQGEFKNRALRSVCKVSEFRVLRRNRLSQRLKVVKSACN